MPEHEIKTALEAINKKMGEGFEEVHKKIKENHASVHTKEMRDFVPCKSTFFLYRSHKVYLIVS